METDLLLKEVKSRGFDSLEDFVRANLHYLSERKRRLFYSIFDSGRDVPEGSGVGSVYVGRDYDGFGHC